MRKSVKFILFFAVLSLIFLMPVVFAVNETINNSGNGGSVSPTVNPTDKVEKGYKCLKERLKNGCSSLTSFEEQIFTLLAMGYDSTIRDDCKTVLMAKMDSTGCWPSGNCNIKQTAQMVLALNNIKENVDKPKAWLESKIIDENQIDWYLQIDSNVKTVCKITYGQNGTAGESYTTTLNEDKTFTAGAGPCLALALNGYHLKINPTCYSKEFTVSCDSGFETSVFSRKGSITYISKEAQSASSSGSTTESVISKCFSLSRSCDYEGTLWASYVIKVLKGDSDRFVPYLNTFMDENNKIMPEAFLYAITEQQVYQNQLITTQKGNEYWLAVTSNDRFFDTPLAILALGTGVPASTNAMNWLMNAQSSDGCWSGVRDTAFILYSGWAKPVNIISTSGPTTPTVKSCTTENFYCETATQCSDAGGDIKSKDLYQCSGLQVCCSKAAQLKKCSELNGNVCGSNEFCSGAQEVDSSDGLCCPSAGTCTKNSELSTCEQNSGSCYSSCPAGSEATTVYSCGSSTNVCCITPQATSGGFSWWWILLLLILIAIIVLAILFRDRLRVEYYKIRYKGKSPPGTPGSTMGPGRPMGPPSSSMGAMRRPMQPMMRRPMLPPGARPMPRRPAFGSQRAVQGTLDRLKR